jgi:hypothetical protein
VSIEQRDNLFAIAKTWFEDEDKILHNRLGALLIKLFVDIEKQQFERRLNDIIPIMIKQLDKKNFDQVKFFFFFFITRYFMGNCFFKGNFN